MSESVKTDIAGIEVAPRINEIKRFSRVFLGRGLVVFGLAVITILIFTAIFAPWISPADPYQTNLALRLIKPCLEHPMGTDYLGRDLLSRIIYGSRTSIVVGLVAIGASSFVGMILGLIAAFFGGFVYTIIMRAIDTQMSIPPIMLSLAVASLLGGGIVNVVVALSIAMIPPYARMMCGQALSVKENDYVIASRALGASNIRTMLGHIAPNCFAPLIVQMTTMLGRAILAEASLSFLGIGIEPPGAAWGAMVNDGYGYIFTDPFLSFFPGIAIMLTVFSFNMVGDGLRDALDPRMRGIL